MKLKTKLYLGFGTVATFMVILFVIIVNILMMLQQNMNEMARQYEKAKLINTVRFEINEMQRRLTLFVSKEDPSLSTSEWEQVQHQKTNALSALENFEKLTSNPSVTQLIQQVYEAIRVHDEIQAKIISAYTDRRQPEAVQLLHEDVTHISNKLYPVIDKIAKFQDDAVSEELRIAEQLKRMVFWAGLALTAFMLSVGTGITLWVVRYLTRRLGGLVHVMNNVSSGSYEEIARIEVKTPDEIGQIAVAFNGMADALEEYVRREHELQRGLREESWLKSQIAEITTGLQGIHDLADLANVFLTNVAPIVGASYAVFYVRQSDKDKTEYVKMAAYAHNGSSPGRETILLGEGLVGQCAADGRAIRISNVPAEYVPIHSGLGQAAPGFLMILPVKHRGAVTAVLEFASFSELGGLEQQLLVQLVNNLGIMIDSVQSHMHIERLLAESQLLQEELQTQAEELTLQQEELKTANEQLEVQYKQSEQRARELEQMKTELEQKNREVERASHYKTEFLANMSHELRTPLNSLLILAQLLLENKEGNLLPNQVEFARTIHQSGSDLLVLINDILDLSKVESGKLSIHQEECMLDELIDGWVRTFSPIAQQKNIEFYVSIPDSVSRTLFTDQQRLQQIVTNLLSNAFKFTEQGEVRLDIYVPEEAELADFPKLRGQQVLAFAVSDTGIGIPSDKQYLVFEAFQQADGSTSRNYGGTGLGLTISRHLARLLGGDITLHSVEGHGSRFMLYLPVSDTAQRREHDFALMEAAVAVETSAAVNADILSKPDAGEDSAETTLNGKRVLIVDDDIRNVFALTTALEGQGMKVVFAENGGEAIELLRSGERVDIVLMDIMMPKIDGYEAMRTIRSMPDCASLPIIALTAKAMKHDRERCIEAGASDYISKPVQLMQLLSLIRVWLYR